MPSVSVLKRLVFCAGAGLGVLGALAPFESRLAGLLAAACLILLSRSLVRSDFRQALGWSALATLSVAGIAFHWVIAGLMNITGLSLWSAVPVFLLQGLIFHFKIAFVVLGARWLMRRTRIAWIWIFPALAAAGDLWFYQLFPWHFGTLTTGGEFVRQFASLTGVYGLSAILFLEAGVVLWLIRLIHRRIRGHAPSSIRVATAGVTIPVLLLVSVYGYGLFRMSSPEAGGEQTVRIGFLQPNTGPGYNTDRDDQAFAGRALNLVFNFGLKTLLEDRGRLDLLIVPESAVPFFGTDDRPGNEGIYSTTFHAIIAFLARYGDVDVLYNEIAAPPPDSRASTTDGDSAARRKGYYNLATVFGRESGVRRASYQKRRLVPFGEYIPGETRWPWLRAIFSETSRYIFDEDKTSGVLPYAIRAAGEVTTLPRLTQADMDVLTNAELTIAEWPVREPRNTGYLQPLICYEGLFPDHVRDLVLNSESPPDFLVNLVNDSWFGDVLENHHHETGARMRSIESGRYLIRPTLTGVSSVFDSRGREVIAPIAIGVQDIRIAEVPRLPAAWTVYLSYGNRPMLVFILSVLVMAFWLRRRR